MITKEKAIDIINKFEFFYGQRAGRELWFDKTREVQELDLKNFRLDCAKLHDYIVKTETKDASNVFELPRKFWLIFNVPGFYDIVEYTTTFITYSCTGLASISGTTGKQEAIVPGKELGITLFFSKEAAKLGLEKLIGEYHNEGT